MPSSDDFPDTPNILWIIVEDVSPRFGCYGDDIARSPNVDRLAEEGRRYTNAFATAPVCSPSRSAVHTGVHQTALGTHHHRASHGTRGLPGPYDPVPPYYVKLLSEYLRQEGYYCTTNRRNADFQIPMPVSAFNDTDPTADYRDRADGQPFFSIVNPSQTHESEMWADEDEEALTTDPAAVEVPPYFPDTPKVRRTLARHYDNIERADEQIGELLDALERDGVLDETVVFLWSDHGEGLPRGKRWLYDSGINVPLIVRWPDEIEGGAVSDRLVSTLDLAPTVLQVAGTDVPTHMSGKSFLGSDDDGEREYIFAARDRHDDFFDTVRAVRDSRYKYIRNYRPDQPYLLWNSYRNRHPVMQELHRLDLEDELDSEEQWFFQEQRPPEELYDLESDSHELDNLASKLDHRSTLERMRGALDEQIDETGDWGLTSEDELVDAVRPDDEQRETEQPLHVPISRSEFGIHPSWDVKADQFGGGRKQLSAPVKLKLHCTTQGASIVYQFANDDLSRWRLYTGPLKLPVGATTVRAKAVRYGYEVSDVSETTYRITAE